MFRRLIARLMVVAGLALIVAASACGGSSIEGTYTAGVYTIDLKPAGKATFAVAGNSMDCTYTTATKKVIITCQGQPDPLELGINDDGSLQGLIIGQLKKK